MPQLNFPYNLKSFPGQKVEKQKFQDFQTTMHEIPQFSQNWSTNFYKFSHLSLQTTNTTVFPSSLANFLKVSKLFSSQSTEFWKFDFTNFQIFANSFKTCCQ